MRNYSKKERQHILTMIALSGICSAGIVGCISNYFYNFALNPNSKKNVFQKDATLQEKQEEGLKKEKEKIRKEWLEKRTDSIFIKSPDKLRLHGYCSNLSSNVYVIICHGYMGKAIDMAGYAKHFYEEGFNILLPDARGHGKSEGGYIGMGWHERLDILQWAHYILEQNTNASIILFGVSMGAATVMMASGEHLPDSVKMVIEDCGYTSVWEQFSRVLKESFKLFPFPIMNFASIMTKIRAGYTLREANALKQVSKCNIPILFIHGDQDVFVPFSMQEKLYQAANCKKQKLVIPGAEHGKAVSADPEKYWKTVDLFIKRNL